MSFFQVPLSCFSVLFSFIIVCAAAPAGGRGPGRARALAVWHTHWAVGSASGSGGPAPGRGPAIEIVIDNRLCILIYVCHTALWTSGELRRGPRFSWRRADIAGSHHRAPASTSHMKPCVEPDGVDLQTQGLRVRAIQPPETGLTRPRGCRLPRLAALNAGVGLSRLGIFLPGRCIPFVDFLLPDRHVLLEIVDRKLDGLERLASVGG